MIQKNFLLAVLLCAMQPMLSINIRYIKDTYTILKPEFKQLSPAYGPVWWEKDIIRNMYDYGLFGADTTARKKDGVTYHSIPYSTIELVRMFFHVVQGSFNATAAPGAPATYFTPRLIGSVLAEFEIARMRVQEIAQSNIKDSKKVLDIARIQKELVDTLGKLLEQDAGYKAGAEAYLKAIQGKKDFSKLQDYFKRNQNRMTAALVGSLEESGFFDLGIIQEHMKNPIFYPPYTTYMILLAFLYRKAENIRNGQDIGKVEYKDFFEALVQRIPVSIFVEQGKLLFENPAWHVGVYNDAEQAIEGYLNEIKESVIALKLGPVEGEEAPAELSDEAKRAALDNLFEKMVFAELSRPKEFPDMAAYRNKSVYMGQTFPNCQDTMMRNLANIISFNHKTNTFDLALLPNVRPAQSTSDFYANPFHKKGSEVENPLTHDAWNIVVQNLFYISYNRLLRLADKVQLCCAIDKNITGFMLSTEILKAKATEKITLAFSDGSSDTFDVLVVNDHKFVLVDPARYAAFEIMPSIKNTIVLMNHLFGLALYENIETQFFNPHFNATYFPKLVAAFDWEIEEEDDDLKLFDTLDYTKEIKVLIETKTGGSFELMVAPEHGEITVFDQEKVEPYQSALVNYIKNTHVESDTEYVTLLTIYALYASGDSILDNPLLLSPEAKAFLYYSQKLKAPHIKETVINDILQRQDQSLYDVVAGLIKSLDSDVSFMNLGNVIRRNDWGQFMGSKGQNKKIETALSNIADNALRNHDDMYSYYELINKDLFIERAIKAAQEKIKSDSQDEKRIALALYDALVSKGLEYDNAFAAAQIGIQSKDEFQIADSLGIFYNLIWKDLHIDEAITASGIASLINDDMVQNRLLNLHMALIPRGKALEDAVVVGNTVMQGNNEFLQEQAIGNFMELLNQNKGHKEVFAAARIGIKSDNLSVQEKSLRLFEALAHKKVIEKMTEQESAEQAEILLEIMQSNYSNNDRRLGILHDFGRLVDRGYGYKEALAAAELAMQNTDAVWGPSLQQQGLGLKNKLLSKSKEFKVEVIKGKDMSMEQMLQERMRNLEDRLKKTSEKQ